MEPERVPWLGVPTIFDFTTTDEQRQVLTFFAGNTRQGRPILAPPDVPADRVAALRRAFDATMKDVAFRKEAQSMGFEVFPQTGERITALVAASLATPAEILKRAQRAATPD
jgi:tripartite-type tricarboxylate transporter receptor subunit TctC